MQLLMFALFVLRCESLVFNPDAVVLHNCCFMKLLGGMFTGNAGFGNQVQQGCAGGGPT